MRCSIKAGLVWAMAAALVAGCGGPSLRPTIPSDTPESIPAVASPNSPTLTPTSSIPPLRGKVTLWVDWDPARIQTLIDAIGGFKTRHPLVEFDVSYYPPDQLRPAFEAAATAHQGPSIIIGPSTWGPAFADQGWIRDLAPYLLPSQQSSIQPVAWDQAADSTSVIGLPLTLEGNILYRNTALAPEPARTVGDLVQTAQTLKSEKGFGASLDFGFLVSAPQLAACDVHLNTQAVVPFDEAGGECWLGLMQRLGAAGKPVFNSNDDRAQFADGKSAWLIDSSLEIDHLTQALGPGVLAIDPWPVDEATGGKLNGFVWSENAYLGSNISNVNTEASWAFLAFLLAPETQATMDDVPGARRVPSVVGVALADPLLETARAQLESGSARPFPSSLNRLTGPLNTALRLVVGQAGDIRLNTTLALQEIENANLATTTPSPTPTPSATATITALPSSTSTPETPSVTPTSAASATPSSPATATPSS
jgi:ABC-type glycerol-3-phosphate transport system substrate-binding protein